MKINTFPITLEKSYMLSPKVKHLVFTCELMPAFDFVPGQFITIHFENEGKMIRRSYSIANQPLQNNKIEFAAGYFAGGPGTELLFNLKPGDTININGPFGRLVFKEEVPKRYVLISTSTGVTPYRAMLNEIARRLQHHANLEVVFLHGVQKRDEVLYTQEFEHFAKQHPRAKFIPCLSREEQSQLRPCEFFGYVQHALPQLNLNPAEDMVYLCGNPGMIDESFNYLKEQGFSIQQIIREKYISN